jgi:uncharacterized membrane protein YgcG
MKKIIVGLLLIVSASCNNAQNNVTVVRAQPKNVTLQQDENLTGFDIQQFANLLKTTTNPDALTQAINANGNTINNLDLDEDKNIDYLKIDQVDNNTLQVVDEIPSGKVIVATLTINTQNNSYAVNGNQDYCGNNYAYQSPTGITFGQLLFLSWMMHPHSYYHPYWGYHRGYYSGYHPYYSHYSRPYTTHYVTERRTIIRNNQRNQNTPLRSLNNNSSQRKFTSRESSRFKSSGGSARGFGGNRSSSSSSTRSSGGFGGSRSGGRR